MTVGILALQGNVDCHQQALQSMGVSTRRVTLPSHLQGLQGLVIPGGETTAMLTLMAPYSFESAIQAFSAAGGAILGTCAGAILLGKQVEPQQRSMGLIDIDIKRNAYGRQLESFSDTAVPCYKTLGGEPIPLVFIRAPQITRVGSSCNVLISHREHPVCVQQQRVMVATFHPELGEDRTVLSYFMGCCQG